MSGRHSGGQNENSEFFVWLKVGRHEVLVVTSHFIYIYIPGTYLSSIFSLDHSKTRSFPIKTRVIWVPGIYIYTPLLFVVPAEHLPVPFESQVDVGNALIRWMFGRFFCAVVWQWTHLSTVSSGIA